MKIRALALQHIYQQYLLNMAPKQVFNFIHLFYCRLRFLKHNSHHFSSIKTLNIDIKKFMCDKPKSHSLLFLISLSTTISPYNNDHYGILWNTTVVKACDILFVNLKIFWCNILFISSIPTLDYFLRLYIVNDSSGKFLQSNGS